MRNERLQIARKRGARLTAAGLGELVDVPEMRIYALERGRFSPRQDEAEKISAVLGVPVNELFPGAKFLKKDRGQA